MSKNIHELPKAKVEKSYLTWSLWLIPIAALGVCAYFVLHDFVFGGPTITIYFQSADGLRGKNSMVKYLGVEIGEVESLRLTKDQKRVAVKVKLDHFAAGVARKGSEFWIVRPQLSVGSISGLRTIVSGNYVTVEPGDGERTNTFIGLSQAPIERVKAMDITLLADGLSSLQQESPIFYRGIQVGEVLHFRLSDDASRVVIDARIREEYAPLVRTDSKFWNAGGINASLGLFSGLEISAESARTVVSGGIAFATPTHYGPPATNGTTYVLNEKENTDWKNWDPVIPLKSVPEGKKPKNTLPQFNSK
jgi:paraquat-inducible protein B